MLHHFDENLQWNLLTLNFYNFKYSRCAWFDETFSFSHIMDLTFQNQVFETKMKKMKYGTFQNYYLWVEEYQLHHGGGELEWRYILVDLCYFPKTLNRYLEEIRKVAIIKRKKKLLIFHRNGSFTLLFMPMNFFFG